MKLQFKHQNFQEEAAQAVVDVFAGQGYLTSDYLIDPGKGGQTSLLKGWRNEPLTPYMTGERLKGNLHAVQKRNGLSLSDKLEGPGVNLTIEMETGTGKTYTYIKTMYELNRAYGWSKFIVVVPSVAIREGVAKSFAVMEEHFAEQYGKKVRHFIYNSAKLDDIRNFAQSNSIQVMIINSQSFTSKEKNLIHQAPDSFQSRQPIEVIAKTNPILIIDEPQSVEGPQTKERLKDFNAFLTLRYSATHKEDYNMVYRLDALDAYNQKLVKKICVKGIRSSGYSATGGFVYLQSINLSKGAPTASIEHDFKVKSGIKKKVSVLGEGDDLYHASNKLDEYKDGFRITRISGVDNSVEFMNGLKLFCGDTNGEMGADVRCEIQIRETIQSHLEREEELFEKGIKVLSLFFIDEVAKYRQYNAAGDAEGGIYARMFEDIYDEEVEKRKDDSPYGRYLAAISAASTHAGYFSVDRKGRMVDSKIKDKKERTSEDVDAYDLIMKNKELLLDRDPVRSPVRFIFSHSALREGWDNPNVFQICTLKKSGSEVRKRQEVGRGMRLCVNQYGERMDENVLGGDVHAVNKLTVIASESYEDFARALQNEMAEAIKGRPVAVTPELFVGRTINSSSGEMLKVDDKTARTIYKQLAFNDYIDDEDKLTEAFYEHKSNGEFVLGKGLEEYSASICQILDTVYNGNALKPENARDANVEARLNAEKLDSPEFKELWSLISPQTVYKVDFDTEKLVETAAAYLNEKLHVSRIYFEVTTGKMDKIQSREALQEGSAFTVESSRNAGDLESVACRVKYDLVGKLVESTRLTRKAIVDILARIKPEKFDMFKANPEEFIRKAADLIEEKVADAIVENIVYTKLDTSYDASAIFKEKLSQKGQLGKNAMPTALHLYDHLIYDSDVEKNMGEKLEQHSDMVVVYAKLPKEFQIATPVTVNGYSPDWAIAFKKGSVRHIYVVAETKGSSKDADLKGVEKAKIKCAAKHFEAISGTDTVFHHVTSFDELYTAIAN